MENNYEKDINIKENMQLSKEEHKKKIQIKDSQICAKEKIYTIGITFILAIIYDEFFNGKQYGVSIPIFYAIFMGFFLWSIRKEVSLKKSIGFSIIIPTLFVALNYSIHSNDILDFFNGIMILVFITLSTVLIRYDNIKLTTKNLIGKVLNRVVKAIPENVLKPFIFIRCSINMKNKKEKNL